MSLLSQDLAAAHCSSPSLPRSTHQREAVTGGPLAQSGKSSQERWGIPGLELGKWGVTLAISFLPQAPVSSATKASMGRATPARLWTASTTPSALSAAPVVSAPQVLDQGPKASCTPCTYTPHKCLFACSQSSCQVPTMCLDIYCCPTFFYFPSLSSTWPSHPEVGSALLELVFPFLFSAAFLPSVPPSLLPLLLAQPGQPPGLGLSLVGFGLGQPSCLGRQ